MSNPSHRPRGSLAAALGVLTGCLGQPDPLRPAAGTSTTTATGAESSGAPETDPGPTCELPQKRCDAVDVLLVIDNSGSMKDDNDRVLYPSLVSNYEEFASLMSDGICSFHIGVTSTEVAPDYQREECRVRGALSRGGAFTADLWGSDPSHPPWLSESDKPAGDDDQDLFAENLLNLLAVGEYYDDDEKQFETIITALGPDLQGEGGCNAGFMREGVPLVVILVTDEDDDDDLYNDPPVADHPGSEGGPEQWFQYLIARKPIDELGMIVLAATESDCEWEPGEYDGTGAEYGVRIMQFVSYFTGAGYGDHVYTIDICQPELDIVEAFGVLDPLFGTLCAP